MNFNAASCSSSSSTSSSSISNNPILILGSSVAAGYYADEDQGWADLLSENIDLANQKLDASLSNFIAKFRLFGKNIDSLFNCGIPGTTVEDILPLVEEAIKRYKPACSIVSLSLANEGLPTLTLDSNDLNDESKRAIAIQKNFISKYQMIASQIVKFTLQYTYNIDADLVYNESNDGCSSIILQIKPNENINQIKDLPWPLCLSGSVYPNNDYNIIHYEILKKTNQILSSPEFSLNVSFKKEDQTNENENLSLPQIYSIPIIDLLTPLEDGCGKWGDGLWIDPGHPNNRGHLAMYRAVENKLKEL